MAKEKLVSKARSLQGWKLLEWFKGNWKTLKELLKVGLPALLAWLTLNNPALVGLATLVGKFLLDVGEFYLKEKREE